MSCHYDTCMFLLVFVFIGNLSEYFLRDIFQIFLYNKELAFVTLS